MDDLQPNTYLPLECENLFAVGWISRGLKYEIGSVGEEFFGKLKELASRPWQPVAAAGKHACELCQYENPSFSDNMYVPYNGKVYVAPVAVIHYIAAHWYKPPEVFIEAVLKCPPMNSMEYKRALLANGGRSLLKAYV